MQERDYAVILQRICRDQADDIDDLLAGFAPPLPRPGVDLFPVPDAVLMPQAVLRRSDAVCVGFRTGDASAQPWDHATRFAAMALERDVEIVVLADTDASGFERFGFRVERIAGADDAARDACLDQIRRFWNLDLVL